MNLQQLEYFKIIAETKNFTTASNMLSVTQPALSKAISKLEEELEVNLFEREGRNIKITKYGEAFLKYAEAALDDIERGKSKLQDMKRYNGNVISIASTNCIGTTFIPLLISNFFNNNLQIKFNINNEAKEDILKDIKNERIDFGFFSENIDNDEHPEIEVILVKREEYVLIVPKNHTLANREEVSLNELQDEYFIAYKDKSYNKKVSCSEILGYTPKISAEPTDGSVLAGLVAAGAGIAIIINTPMINTNRISIIKIKENIGYKNIYMGLNKEAYVSKVKKTFKEYALNLSNDNKELM